MFTMLFVFLVVGAICAAILSNRYGRSWPFWFCLSFFLVSPIITLPILLALGPLDNDA